MITRFRARTYSYALPFLSLCAAFATSAAVPRHATGDTARPPSSNIRSTGSVNGPLLIIDQRGQRSMQVQLGAGHDEILSVQGGAVHRLLGGLTAPCCGLGGLAPSPRGRYIVFSQETLYRSGHAMATAGLWIATSSGAGLHRLLLPPAPTRLSHPLRTGESLSVTSVAWSPDRYTLAYAVNLFTDTLINPDFAHKTGIWLTPYNAPQQRHQVFALAPLGVSAPSLNALCRGSVPNITALSWAPNGHTVLASTDCVLPTVKAFADAQALVSVDVATGRGHVLIARGRDAAISPVTGQIAYVTGQLDVKGKGTSTLWVADAQGGHHRALATGQGQSGQISSPAWSPDGRMIAYITGLPHDGVAAIRVVDIATGHVRTLLAANAPGLPKGGYFVCVTWMHTHE